MKVEPDLSLFQSVYGILSDTKTCDTAPLNAIFKNVWLLYKKMPSNYYKQQNKRRAAQEQVSREWARLEVEGSEDKEVLKVQTKEVESFK